MRGDARFAELTDRIWGLIRDEAWRAIGGDAAPAPTTQEETTT